MSSYPATPTGLMHHDALHADDDPCTYGLTGTCDIAEEIAIIEHEAHSQSLDQFLAFLQEHGWTKTEVETARQKLAQKDGVE